MPVGFIDSDDYILSSNDEKTLFTITSKITSKGFGYTITMNRYFQVVCLYSSYVSDDESPLEVCQCFNTLVNYINNILKK